MKNDTLGAQFEVYRTIFRQNWQLQILLKMYVWVKMTNFLLFCVSKLENAQKSIISILSEINNPFFLKEGLIKNFFLVRRYWYNSPLISYKNYFTYSNPLPTYEALDNFRFQKTWTVKFAKITGEKNWKFLNLWKHNKYFFSQRICWYKRTFPQRRYHR